jgi:DNA-binding NarL/FixJ family response regulator
MGGRTKQPTLVLADDHPSFVDASRRLLECDFEIVAAVHSGPEAVEAVRRLDPDLVVLDISMPGMSGIEVMEALKGHPTRIVVLTVHRDAAIADRVADLGACAYVTKARMARDLLPAVRAALAGESFRSAL